MSYSNEIYEDSRTRACSPLPVRLLPERIADKSPRSLLRCRWEQFSVSISRLNTLIPLRLSNSILVHTSLSLYTAASTCCDAMTTPIEKQQANVGLSSDAESLLSETTRTAIREGIKPAFYAKVNVLNKAIADIGMGRYQWELFVTAGFGWMADNICAWIPSQTACSGRGGRVLRLQGFKPSPL